LAPQHHPLPVPASLLASLSGLAFRSSFLAPLSGFALWPRFLAAWARSLGRRVGTPPTSDRLAALAGERPRDYESQP